jgi:2-(1,2-epoxy-1,2-dihydrophenyl)acetyl-CoA isomerase
MAYEQLIVDLDGAVATLRLNNPDKLNALSREMTEELIEELTRLRDDSSVRAIVITGEGRGFSAGADLSALEKPYLAGERPKPSAFLKEGYNRLIPLLAQAPKPVVAAINGVAAGAGISLALACDFRIAAENAAFAMAFVRIGLIPDSGATYLLPRAVGMSEALRLALSGEKIDAGTAGSIGLVHRVVPANQLRVEAHALATYLAGLPTQAIALTKRIFMESSGLSLAEAMDREAEAQDRAAATEDHLEGVLAFLQKRSPSFTGT